MTEEQIKQKFKETYPDFMRGDEPLSPYFDIWEYGIEIATKELQEDLEHKKIAIQTRKARIKELEKQIEKGRNIIHRLLVVIQRHKWWNYEVMEEARAFMGEVDCDKDHD